MTIQKAIEKAIEGGYEEGKRWKFIGANCYWVYWLNGNGDETSISLSMYLLNPLFWQAFGKGLKWNIKINISYTELEMGNSIELKKVPYWIYKWHRFIDHLAEGKKIEDFFKNLE